MTEEELKNMPLSELEKMVAGIPTSQMDTDKTSEDSENKSAESIDTTNNDNAEWKSDTKQSEDSDKSEHNKEDNEEKEEKKTPESIKKLLHQRSELRQDNDRLKTELEEAKEQLRKLRSWELDSEFKNSEWELDIEKKEEAIQDASQMSKIIEREYSNSNRSIESNRELEMAKFIIDNPDLVDVKDELMNYANAHKDLDIEDIKYLVLSKIDPTRLLDEQTKNKLNWDYSLPWKSSDWKEKVDKDYSKMSASELKKEVEKLGII